MSAVRLTKAQAAALVVNAARDAQPAPPARPVPAYQPAPLPPGEWLPVAWEGKPPPLAVRVQTVCARFRERTGQEPTAILVPSGTAAPPLDCALLWEERHSIPPGTLVPGIRPRPLP